jgi:ribonuclease Z
MVPRRPPRVGQIGFVYVPPYRIQGVSVAGEQTMVQIPELDVAFDIGMCPRVALASPYVALSHAHMDHVGGLPYYFSQRVFQRMGTGTCVCPEPVAEALRAMMQSWVALEDQRTPHEIVPLRHGEQIQVKNNIFLRAVEVSHTVPALGYALIERRSKLRPEFADLPQERLREIKQSGQDITRTIEIPLVAYTGDTELCPNLFCESFTKAKVIIAECTFFEPDHKARSKIGKHIHVDDLQQLLEVWEAETVVLVHVSRRTNIGASRELLARQLGDAASRVVFLMDHGSNRARYEQQQAESEGE